MTYLSSDRIRVFVSSRLGECKAERGRARDVIESLGHQPVMFEAAGARPYAPRSVYLQGLDESQIFVGIYREGYGYIADDMQISGLEDEYRVATSLGIPKLLYVLRGAKMEPELSTLVDEFMGPDITVSFFDDATEVAKSIRTDLVALVSDYFTMGRSYAQVSPTIPGAIVDALVPPNRRLRRESVEVELEAQLGADPVALVKGPLGSGKTVFLSALSNDRDWAFVECGEKPPQEVLSDAANAVRALLGLPASAFLRTTDAQSALQTAWDDSQSVTLVLDDLRHHEAFDLVRSVASVSNSHRLIVSSRADIPTVASVYDLPPLELEETQRFVQRHRDELLMPGELVQLHNASRGNPLYLRYYLSGQPGEYISSVTEYETRVWYSLTPSARELLYYLAWSSRPLSLQDLADLFSGSSDSTEELADTIASAGSLLAQAHRGYSIFHPHAKSTIQDLARRSPPHLQFYIERLRKWFFDKRDYVAAFGSLDSAGFPTPPNLLELAGRQAAVTGDFRMAIRILKAQINLAQSSYDTTRERDLSLYLAHVLSLCGRVDQALEMIDRVAAIPAETDPPFIISELRATIGALGSGNQQAFKELLAKQENYRRDGKLWDAARLSVDLSVYYVRQSNPERAADEANFAMEVFKAHHDNYGYRIARGNYLSAISSLSGKTVETDNLIQEIESEIEQEPRQRALLCNVLARRARKRGDTAGAKAYALEAIEIGRDFGDHAIVCNNLMNLGNSYRAEGSWESAIAQYEAADKLARDSRLVLSEAAAQELLASVFNRKRDGERALHHANYAISIARGASSRIESNATEQLAQAYELVGQKNRARDAWIAYAGLEIERTSDLEAGSYGFYRAVKLLTGRNNVQEYVAAYHKLFGVLAPKQEGLSLGERLLDDLPDLFQRIALEWTFEAAVYHATFMFSDVSKTLARRIYLMSMRRIFREGAFEAAALKRLRIALALSMALPRDTLRLCDIVDIGECISARHTNISFRASSDGAAHWTIELMFGRSIIVSVIQIDDRPDVSLITLCLILVLVAFAPDMFEDVLSRVPPKRVAANVQVCNFNEARELFSLGKIGLHSEPAGCAVTRATDVDSDANTPIFVITSDTVTKDWLPGSGSVNYGQTLFARVLVELVFHMQAGEIELDSLYPKISRLIAKMIL